MRKLLAFIFLIPGLASAQIAVQKASGTNQVSNGPIVIGSGNSLTPTGSGIIIATAGTASTMPWSGLTAIPSPTASFTGDATGALTLLAGGGATGALTLATVNTNVGTFAGLTVNGKGLVTAASALTSLVGYGVVNGSQGDALIAVSSNGILQRTALNTYSVATYTGGSLVWTTGNLTLSGDAASPGNGYNYGTNAVGTKGWYLQTSDAALTNSTGVSTITPTSQIDTENVTLSGSASARSIVLATGSATPGARCDLLFTLPATSGVAVTVYSGSTSGPTVQTFTTTSFGPLTARLTCNFSGGQWNALYFQGPIP